MVARIRYGRHCHRVAVLSSTSSSSSTTSHLWIFSTLSFTILTISTFMNEKMSQKYLSCCEEECKSDVIRYNVCKPLSDEEFKNYMNNIKDKHPDRPIFVLFMGE